MESLSVPLEVLHEDASWFTRATELRLLRVGTTVSLRDAVDHVVLGQLHHADNQSLYFAFDDPARPDHGDWDARCDRFVAAWEEQRAGYATQFTLGGLGPTIELAGRLRFAALLRAAAGAISRPISSLVMVMRPVRIEAPERWVDAMLELMTDPTLGAIRWVCIDLDHDHSAPLVHALGPERALDCTCRVDEGAQRDDLRTLIDGAKRASDASNLPPTPGAAGVVASAPAGVGAGVMLRGAGPNVMPPPRVDAREPPSDALLREAGIEPRYCKGGAALLEVALLEAALAQREGRAADCIEHQTRAVGLCAEMGLSLERVLNLIVLGGYFLAAQRSDEAQRCYESAVELAERESLFMQRAQGLLALGMLHVLCRRPEPAVGCYRQAAELAESIEQPALALEAWRMAGQVASDHRAEDQAAIAWLRGLELAGKLAPESTPPTSASELALLLAAHYRGQGSEQQARALEDAAQRLAHGQAPDTPVERKAAGR